MAIDIRQLDSNRLKLLNALYEMKLELGHYLFPWQDVQKRAGLDVAGYQAAYLYLEEVGFVEGRVGGGARLTTHGMVAFEEALRRPGERIEGLPPVNLIYAGQITNSVIQQAGSGSNQSATLTLEVRDRLLPLLEQLVSALVDVKLDVGSKQVIDADLASIKAQLKSVAPKKSVIATLWSSVRSILENAAGGLVASGALALIPEISKLLS